MEAAFFDLDKTIVSRSSSFTFARPMYRAGMVTRGTVIRGAYAQLVYLLLGADEKRLDRAKETLLRLTKGWEQTQVEQLIREVMSDVIDPFVYQEALELMQRHHDEGREIYIVSSSPEEVVRPLAEHFGADGVIATRAETEDGRYTGNLEFYAFGESKAVAMRELAGERGIDLEASYGYSDSSTDIPMLEAVGHPVVVNADRELRREAALREWPMLAFDKPVRLDGNGSGRGRGGATIAAATVSIFAAGLLVWAFLRSRRSRHQQAIRRFPSSLRRV